MESADLLLTLITGAESLQRFLGSPEADENESVSDPERLRSSLPRRYRNDIQPRVPERPEVNRRSGLLLCKLVSAVDQMPGGFQGIPIGTTVLMSALCGPFCNPNGFPVPIFASQPFMVLEHRQLYRLLTASLLHRNLAHLTNNLSSLAHSGSRLETKVGLPAFAAMATSLMLSSNALEVLYSCIAYKRLDDWRTYFLTTNVGASGLVFAIKVVGDHKRNGLISFIEVVKIPIPVQFSCWPQLLLSQILLPQENVSFTRHLCGIFAGLLHVFLPKAVKQLQKPRKRRQERTCKQQRRQHHPWLQRILAATTTPASQVHSASKVHPEDASWSDLQVHVICAIVSLGGHQVLRMLQKRLRRQGDHSHRHSQRESSAQTGNSIDSPQVASSAAESPIRDRRNSNTARFL